MKEQELKKKDMMILKKKMKLHVAMEQQNKRSALC